MNPREACRLADLLLGRRPDRLESFRPAAGGDDSHSFRLWDRGKALLLKVMARPGTPIGAYFYGRLRQARVPVPDLVAFSPDGGPGKRACGVFEWVHGTPAEFASHERPPYDEAEFGRLLRAIHDLRHDSGFGRLDDHGRTSHSRWSEWVSDLLAWGATTCVRRRAFGPELADSLRRLPEEFAAELAAAPPALLHYGDIMHNGNLIVDPDSRRVLAVVDFSDAIVGDPRLELAWIDLYFGAYGHFGRGFDLMRFREAYGDDGDLHEPTRLLYVCLALMTMLTYVDPGTPRGEHHRKLLHEIVEHIP
ncbi:MAG: aminoglycoside phosphotransferase family protein [Armatimonadota bacterium]|nr:MAG: aminoglycoside phosphotransferase family protein [Armatimonadota bacterium]